MLNVDLLLLISRIGAMQISISDGDTLNVNQVKLRLAYV